MIKHKGLQVLASVVKEHPLILAEKMNLQTDSIVVDQCNQWGYEEIEYLDYKLRAFYMDERGVGLSRNTALIYADHEYVLFTDEDIHFYDGYEQMVLSAFEKNPDADLITFNLKVDERRRTYINESERRIRWYNYGRYPTFSVAAKLSSLRKANVSFSHLFGGGAKYSAGEDSLFLHDCLKAGLHLYTSVTEIGEEVYRKSTWFEGYNEKFFIDRGVLYPYLYGRMASVFALRFLVSHRKEMCQEIPFSKAFKLMKKGIKEGRARG